MQTVWEASGDRFAYRERGYIQLTGMSNYNLFDKTLPEGFTPNNYNSYSNFPSSC